MSKSTKSTEIAKIAKIIDDLEKFTAGPPSHRLDDKAAELEEEIQTLKVECKRIYFVLTFIATVFFMLFVASVATTAAISIAIVFSLIFLVGTANWLDFPWVTKNLQQWLNLLLKRRSDPEEEVEPNSIENENSA